MVFSLTDALISEIQTALENQDEEFLINAQSGSLLKIEGGIKADEENFYRLPEWSSTQGFKLRESFVNSLHAPLAREELQQILHGGRGVFRNFKNVLKRYPEVEKRWFVFRNRAQREVINQWYNSLREVWGLEKLDYVPESDENLVHNDFSFEDFSENAIKLLVENAGYFFRDDEEQPEEISAALYEMWKTQFESTEPRKQIGFVCRSISDDFAGCISASPVTKKWEQVMILTSLYVPKEFRGLGIGTELLSMCLSKLKECGKKWLLIPNIILPENLLVLLTRNGFEKTGSGLAAKLF